jgi:Zn finger protein HypA/HybF involved in hydrogenase expression
MSVCEYGCNQEAKFQLNNGKMCCENNCNKCLALRKRNSEAIKQAHKEGKLNGWGKQKNVNRNWSKGKTFWEDERIKSKYNKNEIFIENSKCSSHMIKEIYIKYIVEEYKCSICGIIDWNNKELVLQLDHINGTHTDNRLENLRLLCPNCHAQTDTFCGKENKNLIYKTEEEIIDAIKNSHNIRQALIRLNLTAKGKNYVRIKKTKQKYNLSFLKKEEKIIENVKVYIEPVKYYCENCKQLLKKKTKTSCCGKCSKILQRKVIRPSYTQLQEELKTMNFCQMARKYNVSDNAIRKWLIFYEKEKLVGAVGHEPTLNRV